MKPQKVQQEREALVDMLWTFYVAAGRPSMARIAQAILELDEDVRTGTANHETVRRTLSGSAVGSWLTVEVVFLALCELADVDPDDKYDHEDRDRWDPLLSHRQLLKLAWNRARDGVAPPTLPRTRAERARQEAETAKERARVNVGGDPWGPAPPVSGGGFNDDPPF
jgi:hypothetical protein